jgi:hypothetical protein
MSLLIRSALIGFTIGSVPFWVWMFLRDSATLPAVQGVANYLLLPGLLVSLATDGGRVHDVNLLVMVISSCVFYTALIYLVFRIRKRLLVKT